jgi:hypothetical protein
MPRLCDKRVRKLMQQQRQEEQQRRANSKGPDQRWAPALVCGAEFVRNRQYDQKSNQEPAVVQSDLDAADAAEFYVRSHFTFPPGAGSVHAEVQSGCQRFEELAVLSGSRNSTHRSDEDVLCLNTLGVNI